VVDLEGVEFNSVLQTLPSKILDSDPYIKLIRAGRNKPGVVRLVIELKGEVRPQVFSLKPVGEYGHRLVLDLHPAGAGRSADGAAGKIRRSAAKPAQGKQAGRQDPAERQADKPETRNPMSRAWSPSCSTPDTAAKIRARSAVAAATKRT
jgi:N-acetylmuramoyl-L-alanine amidase